MSMEQVVTASLRQFRHDIRRGLGSALVTLRSSADPRRHADAVRWACLHLTAYDPQCEGSRGWYLHQAAVLTGQAGQIEADVIGRFAVCSPNGWRFAHLSDILVCFALAGSDRARQALWDAYARLMARFARTVRHDRWWYWQSTLEGLALDLVRLDGWEAARVAIADFGAGLASGPREPGRAPRLYFPEWFDAAVREQFGEADVDAFLAGETSPGVRAYGETATTVAARPSGIGQPGTDLRVETLTALALQVARGDLDPLRLRSAAMRLARQDTAGADQVARLGLAQADPSLKAEILWAFRTRDFPLTDDDLASLVDVDHDRLRLVVRTILGQRPAEWKRRHALDLLQTPHEANEALDLLQASYRPEDEPVVDAAIRRVSVRDDDWHGTFGGVLDLLTPADRPVTTGVLEYVYRQTLCSTCRRHTLDLMSDKHVLPDGIVRECLLDASDEIRSFATRITDGT